MNTGGANVRYGNDNNYQTSLRIRDQVGLSSTCYLSGLLGTYEAKVGADHESTSAVGVSFTTGTPGWRAGWPAHAFAGEGSPSGGVRARVDDDVSLGAVSDSEVTQSSPGRRFETSTGAARR